MVRRDQKISLPLSPQLILWVGAGKWSKAPKMALLIFVDFGKIE